MFDKRAIDLIKQQVLKEVYSSYLYVEFANYFKDKGLDGFYNWYNIQAKEELDHAKLFIKYLKKIGVDVISLAGNHALDYGYSGLCRTIDVLDESDISHLGTYKTLKDACEAYINRKEKIIRDIANEYKNIIPEHVLYWIEFLSEIEESNKADNN